MEVLAQLFLSDIEVWEGSLNEGSGGVSLICFIMVEPCLSMQTSKQHFIGRQEIRGQA